MADHRFRFLLPGPGRLPTAVAFSLILVACGGSGDGNSDGNSSDDSGAPPANEAQAIYIEQGCAECHGEEGEGTERGKAIAGTRMIPLAFETRVRNGRGAAMPGYSEEQISADEVQLLLEWLQNK